MKMEIPEVVEHFFGVYLLYCMNPKYKGRTYIGYTVDPRRRIKQHNAGKKFGGAWKTSNRGPWNMVLVVHGFPSSTAALRASILAFEWAWQHPDLSRRLKHIPKKKNKATVFEYRLSVLSEMLKVGPWCRLPLTLRWLDYEFSENYNTYVSPPMHMPISYGKVTSQNLNKKGLKKKKTKECTPEPEDPLSKLCSLCRCHVNKEDKVTCVKPDCFLIAHLICLAKIFVKDKMILPVDGNCPSCKTNILWGDVIRKKLGCYLHLPNKEGKSADNSYDSDALSD